MKLLASRDTTYSTSPGSRARLRRSPTKGSPVRLAAASKVGVWQAGSECVSAADMNTEPSSTPYHSAFKPSSHAAVCLQAALSPSPQHARDMSSTLSLANIRSTLIRFEDTIIFNFIERAQFARDDAVYTSDAIPVPREQAGHGKRCLRHRCRHTCLHDHAINACSPPIHAPMPHVARAACCACAFAPLLQCTASLQQPP